MLNILRKASVYKFVFGQLNFQKQKIDVVIVNYDDGAIVTGSFWEEALSRPCFVCKRNKKIMQRNNA